MSHIALNTRFELFAPGEVETITGISSALIRKWRERGLLPANNPTEKGSHHSRFTGPEIVGLLALESLDRTRNDKGAVGLAIEAASEIAAVWMWKAANGPGSPPGVTSKRGYGGRYVAVSGMRYSMSGSLEKWPFPIRERTKDGAFSFTCFDAIAAAEMVEAAAPRPVVSSGS